MKKHGTTLTLTFALFLSGCASVAKYAPSPAWEQKSVVLGEVTADSGKWPLSLKTPPNEYTYQSALLDKAAAQFGVPRDQVALGEVTVKFMAEIDGTIRSWKASSVAGRK